MANQCVRVARVNRPELLDLPPDWTDQECGQYLRLLLQLKGIDPNRFYYLSYHPDARCWLLTQKAEAGLSPPPGVALAPARLDELFYPHVMAQFRWAARTACAAQAAHSQHFARSGSRYQLPAAAHELSPGDFAKLLGGASAGAAPETHFDGEGGWRVRPSAN